MVAYKIKWRKHFSLRGHTHSGWLQSHHCASAISRFVQKLYLGPRSRGKLCVCVCARKCIFVFVCLCVRVHMRASIIFVFMCMHLCVISMCVNVCNIPTDIRKKYIIILHQSLYNAHHLLINGWLIVSLSERCIARQYKKLLIWI